MQEAEHLDVVVEGVAVAVLVVGAGAEEVYFLAVGEGVAVGVGHLGVGAAGGIDILTGEQIVHQPNLAVGAALHFLPIEQTVAVAVGVVEVGGPHCFQSVGQAVAVGVGAVEFGVLGRLLELDRQHAQGIFKAVEFGRRRRFLRCVGFASPT